MGLTAPAGGAVRPNVQAPPGVQVWLAEPMLRPGRDAEYGDPFEPPRETASPAGR